MSWDEQAFKQKLEDTHDFPGEYTFKFIIKPEHKESVTRLIKGASMKLKPSSGKKYLSVTLQKRMASSQEVVDVYKEAYKIDGIISL